MILLRRGPRSRTASAASPAAPTTTCRSRSPTPSCWPACRRCTSGSGASPARDLIAVGPLEVDVLARAVRAAGTRSCCRRKEFELLATLARDPVRVIPKAELLERIWGYRNSHSTRTLDCHASRLRRRLEAELPRHALHRQPLGRRLRAASARPRDATGAPEPPRRSRSARSSVTVASAFGAFVVLPVNDLVDVGATRRAVGRPRRPVARACCGPAAVPLTRASTVCRGRPRAIAPGVRRRPTGPAPATPLRAARSGAGGTRSPSAPWATAGWSS